METVILILIIAVSFILGVYTGVWLIYHIYLKDGIDKGIMKVGKETYRVSKFVSRNTRV